MLVLRYIKETTKFDFLFYIHRYECWGDFGGLGTLAVRSNCISGIYDEFNIKNYS